MTNSDSERPTEEIAYLEEVLGEYSKSVESIGHRGLAANLILYYRTEVEETLRDLEGKAPLESYWLQTVELDNQMREKRTEIIGEIGWQTYKMERAAV